MDEEQIKVDIVVKSTSDGKFLFEIKEPLAVNDALNKVIERKFSRISIGSFVVYPDNKVLENQSVFIDTSSLL
jgi:hypothetical protein